MGTITYTTRDRDVVALLKANANGMTMESIAEALNIELKPGHMVSMMKRNLIEVVGDTEIVRMKPTKKTAYHFVTADVLKKEDGKNYNYTDNETALLKVAATMEGDFTLAELATAMGKEKLSSGSINGLVKKGNIVTRAEKVDRLAAAKKSVNVYGFKSDIPTGAVIADIVKKVSE